MCLSGPLLPFSQARCLRLVPVPHLEAPPLQLLSPLLRFPIATAAMLSLSHLAGPAEPPPAFPGEPPRAHTHTHTHVHTHSHTHTHTRTHTHVHTHTHSHTHTRMPHTAALQSHTRAVFHSTRLSSVIWHNTDHMHSCISLKFSQFQTNTGFSCLHS